MIEMAEIRKSDNQVTVNHNIRKSGLKIEVFIRVNSWF